MGANPFRYLNDIEKKPSNKKHVTGETGPEAETLHAFEKPGAETQVLT